MDIYIFSLDKNILFMKKYIFYGQYFNYTTIEKNYFYERMNERMSFIGQLCYMRNLLVTAASQCNRMTATWQDTDNKIILY